MKKICENCKHWTNKDQWGRVHSEIYQGEGEGYGVCLVAADSSEKKGSHRAAYDGGYTGDFVTRKDFGCNQWTAK